MMLSSYQQLQQGPSAYQRLQQGLPEPAKTRRVGGVRRRDETQDQMQQRLYGGNQQTDANGMDMLFPGNQQQNQMQPQNNDMNMLFNAQDDQVDQMDPTNQGLSGYQQLQQGQSAFQKLQQSPFGQSSSTVNSVRRAGGVRKRNETQQQMQQRLGQYGSLVNG